MMPIRKFFDSFTVMLAMVVWLVFFAVIHLWPASHWLEVESVVIANVKPGEPVPMAVIRHINEPFVGTWSVSVRRWGANGWVQWCAADGNSIYKNGAELPDNLTLDWWTAGACKTLVDGRYIVSTTWGVNPFNPVWPKKFVQAESNIFEVKE